jgi:hypothetical protein
MTIFVCAAALFAQPQPQPPQTSTAGLEPAWEIGPVLEEVANHAERLLPILAQADVKMWMEKGASATYAEQLQSSQDQAAVLANGARALARNPEKLSASLELVFRIESLENMLASLVDGLRKYQSQQAAQQLASVDAEGGVNRERLRRYIVNLAAEREQQFEAMDREAQRCRSGMLAQPAPTRTSERKK